jgi:hypothetical protein
VAAASQVLDGSAVNVFVVTNDARFSPGQMVLGDWGGCWVYGQASGSLFARATAHLNNSMQATGVTTASSPRGAPVGVAMAAMTNGQWGWFQRAGQVNGSAASAIPAGARLNTTATAGSLDDDGTVGAKTIEGMGVLVAVGVAGSVELTLSFPFIGATL